MRSSFKLRLLLNPFSVNIMWCTMEKRIINWQMVIEWALKLKYNDVASGLSGLPTFQTSHRIFLSVCSVFFPSLSLCVSSLLLSLFLSLSRNLSYNNLTRLDEGSLAVLGDLHTLRLGHNSISHINEGAFRGLKALRIL